MLDPSFVEQDAALAPKFSGGLVAAFHNTKRKPLLEAISFRLNPGLLPTGI